MRSRTSAAIANNYNRANSPVFKVTCLGCLGTARMLRPIIVKFRERLSLIALTSSKVSFLYARWHMFANWKLEIQMHGPGHRCLDLKYRSVIVSFLTTDKKSNDWGYSYTTVYSYGLEFKDGYRMAFITDLSALTYKRGNRIILHCVY